MTNPPALRSPILRICPKCGSELRHKKHGGKGHRFIGCAGFPACDYTEPYPSDLWMREKGAAMLPGMEAADDR
jgi:ssDNA-binding Zn-finger/Zn-ribbon topoisomerase 1